MLALGALGTGSVLSASRLLRGAVVGLLSPATGEAASCILTPEQTEGPYYIDDEPFRKNVTEGRAGTPLVLVLRVVNASTCAPIPNAVVESRTRRAARATPTTRRTGSIATAARRHC